MQAKPASALLQRQHRTIRVPALDGEPSLCRRWRCVVVEVVPVEPVEFLHLLACRGVSAKRLDRGAIAADAYGASVDGLAAHGARPGTGGVAAADAQAATVKTKARTNGRSFDIGSSCKRSRPRAYGPGGEVCQDISGQSGSKAAAGRCCGVRPRDCSHGCRRWWQAGRADRTPGYSDRRCCRGRGPNWRRPPPGC
jgi:hypothetical protein